VFTATGNHGRLYHKYNDAIVERVNGISSSLDPGAIGDALEVRYPFLYRPLVEFALRLPPELCARPHARKWVLREAMRGILPEVVRTRVGKGASTDVLVRSLIAQRALLEPLTHNSILAELDLIDEVQFRAAFATAPLEAYSGYELCGDIQATLMVEAWLRIRAGRWPQGLS
jgi:asparagine synthase (glutamine-hydrolysing)